jgi:hypothetical protein
MTQSSEARIDNPEAIKTFMFSGAAIFTLRSMKTGIRYTYRVSEADKKNPSDETVYFVGLLTGTDNMNDYTYMGMVRGGKFRLTKASKMNMQSVPVVTFDWTLTKLNQRATFNNLEFWHAGRCGRCARPLTDPTSIAAGFGPECILHVGGAQSSLPLEKA